MSPLTFEQIKAFCEKLEGNGFKDELPPGQMMHEGVPYETCDICTKAKGFHVMHPVGVSHAECA